VGGRRWYLVQKRVESSESAAVVMMVLVVEILSESFR
jgi:hypothetical protein